MHCSVRDLASRADHQCLSPGSQEAANAANAGAAEIAPSMRFTRHLTDIEFRVGSIADSASNPI